MKFLYWLFNCCQEILKERKSLLTNARQWWKSLKLVQGITLASILRFKFAIVGYCGYNIPHHLKFGIKTHSKCYASFLEERSSIFQTTKKRTRRKRTQTATTMMTSRLCRKPTVLNAFTTSSSCEVTFLKNTGKPLVVTSCSWVIAWFWLLNRLCRSHIHFKHVINDKGDMVVQYFIPQGMKDGEKVKALLQKIKVKRMPSISNSSQTGQSRNVRTSDSFKIKNSLSFFTFYFILQGSAVFGST